METKLALRPEYSLGHSQFNDFLFAFVGEEKSGMQLTVLSALARLNFDPWQEAARLSEMSREAATSALATALAALPEGDWKGADSRSIAAHLVMRLPTQAPPAVEPPQDKSVRGQQPNAKARSLLVWIALAAAVFAIASYLYGG